MPISIFKNTFSTEQAVVSIEGVLSGIKNGRWAEQILRLRSLSPEEYKKEKTHLPAVTWAGVFSERVDAAITEYSGVMCLDIDHIDSDKITLIKSQLEQDEYCYFAFVSPSNEGLKVGFCIDTTSEFHLHAFLHLQKYFQEKYFVKVDDAGKNISRLCYVSYDELCYFNKNSKLFIVDKAVGETFNKAYSPRENFSNYKPLTDPEKIFELCVKWVEKTMSYAHGGRNRYVHAIACAMNRCGVDFNATVSIVKDNYADLDEKEKFHCCRSAYFQNQHEHGAYNVKDIEALAEFKAPPYVANYTDDVVANDIMRITAMLTHYGVSKADLGDIVSKVSKYYKLAGMIDLDRKTLAQLMNDAINAYNSKVVERTSENSLKYQTLGEMAMDIINTDFDANGIRTFFPWIDSATRGGLKKGNFYGLIGLGSTYKSILSEYIIYKNAMAGIPSLYLNGEMSSYQFYERIIAMALRLDLYQAMAENSIRKDNIEVLIQQVDEMTNGNIFVVNGSGFNAQNILASIENIEAKTGKRIQLVVADGITQMEDIKNDEIRSAIHNSQICKEVAKTGNVAFIGLLHVSGDIQKHTRNTGARVRGGIKVLANMDGYFCTSLLIDQNLEEYLEDDTQYIDKLFYLRFVDKRSQGGEVNAIIRVNDFIQLEQLNDSVHNYEVKLK